MPSNPTPLKQFLRSEGRRQNWLAERAGIDPATLSRIVTGRLNPNERERAAIAEALGRSASELWPADREAA